MAGWELLRDLVFGRGRYARAGAPEPTLLPRLLGSAPPALLARAALSGDFFHVAQSHPALRTDLFATIDLRFTQLSGEDQAALLEREPWRYRVLLKRAAHAAGPELGKLVNEIAHMRDFWEHADLVADLSRFFPPSGRSEFLSVWLRDQPSYGDRLGPEWACWALTRVVPLLPGDQSSEAVRGALTAARQLSLAWQRAEAIRQLRGALDTAPVTESFRSEVGAELFELAPADEPWRSHLHRYIEGWLRGPWPIDRQSVDQPTPPAQVFDSDLKALLAASAARPVPSEPQFDPGVMYQIQIPGQIQIPSPAPAPADTQSELQRVLNDGIGAALGRWSGRQAAARAPRPDAPPPRGVIDEPEEFDLGVGRSTRAKPPVRTGPPTRSKQVTRPRPRVVNTGFAETTAPEGHHDPRQPLEPGKTYYYWLEIKKKKVKGAIDVGPSTLPEDVPAEAELAVVLFAPDGGFDVSQTQNVGRVRVLPNGTGRVVAQPASRYDGIPAWLLETRMLFPLRTAAKPGRHALRCNLYYQGVLVQSRLVEASVGQAPDGRTPALVSKVDYTLSRTLAPGALHEIEAHGLSVMMNRNANGNHDFLFYGGNVAKPLRRSVTISADTLHGAITQGRTAMRKVSWDDEGEYAAGKPNRYKQPRPLADLRVDLTRLAARGYDIYDLVVSNLADDDVDALETALRKPGVLQIAGKEDIRFVLPAGLIYDHPLDNQARPIEKYDLCPAFSQAFGDRTPLSTTRCFQGDCPSRGEDTTICPSGFWGFRHAIGLPISLGTGGQADDLAPRLKYQDVPVIVVAVSTAPDLPARENHAKDMRKLRNEWSERAWWLGDSRAKVLDFLATSKPHLVYFYCHGGSVERGGMKVPCLSVGPLSDRPIIRSNVGARVRWEDPRPLVFINGCHTAALDADSTLDFVTGFVQRARACGVIGTEITVFESLAGTFATAFWRLFLAGKDSVGEAVRQARLELLQAGNPLGLVYTPFVFAGTKLEKIT